jgi:PAS domain S-box-containing protein
MKRKHAFLLMALGFGFAFWTIEALADHLFFYKSPFIELLLTNIPPHELFVRFFMLALLLAFGWHCYNSLHNKQQAEQKSRSILKAYQESERRYRSLFYNSLEGVYLHDLEGRFLDANGYLLNLLGYSRDELKNLNFNNVFHDSEQINKAYKTLKEIINTGLQLEITEFRLQSKSGKIIWVETKASMIYENGKPSAIQGIARDVTQRKHYEEQLLANEEKLKETNQYLADMIYIASHDLQSPLVTLQGYAMRLMDTHKSILDQKGVEKLTRINKSAKKMQDMVISLLDLSRLNTVHYDFEKFLPDQIIHDMINGELYLMLHDSKVEISTSPMPEMYADKKRMEGVFRKLIQNAINYGGKKINIGYTEDAYFVKDDGIGIPQDQLEKIFVPGERLKSNEADGCGMGLTFCRNVIKKHSGSIWAESDGEGKGAVFKFTVKT